MLEYNSEFVGQLMDLGMEQQEAIDCLRVCTPLHDCGLPLLTTFNACQACNNDVVKAADFFFNQSLEEVASPEPS